jgi:hypothetical protein
MGEVSWCIMSQEKRGREMADYGRKVTSAYQFLLISNIIPSFGQNFLLFLS